MGRELPPATSHKYAIGMKFEWAFVWNSRLGTRGIQEGVHVMMRNRTHQYADAECIEPEYSKLTILVGSMVYAALFIAGGLVILGLYAKNL